MADHHKEEEKKDDSLMEKIADKISAHDSSSSSSSDSEDEKKSSLKAKVYRLFGREKPVHRVLGGGKRSADMFLWRDVKVLAGVLGGATAIWVLFDVLEYHLLTLVCYGLILGLVGLFLWSNAITFIKKRGKEKKTYMGSGTRSSSTRCEVVWVLCIASSETNNRSYNRSCFDKINVYKRRVFPSTN